MTVRATGSLDGAGAVALFTQCWLPDDATTVRGTVVIAHGLGEHSDRYDHVAGRLTDEGLAVSAVDHRGHGRSQGPRAVIETDAVVADVDQLVRRAAGARPDVPLFLLGHSLGAMIAVAYALAHGERLDGLILSGPLAAVDASPALAAVGRLVSVLAPRAPTIALDPALVSRDGAVVAAYRADPLVHHGRIPARTAAQISETVRGFPDAVGAITVPTLIVYGTADGLCPPRGSVMLSERIGADDITVRAYEGLFHEVLNEPERETVITELVDWLDQRAPAIGRR
jgi:acylglycerol lipase